MRRPKYAVELGEVVEGRNWMTLDKSGHRATADRGKPAFPPDLARAWAREHSAAGRLPEARRILRLIGESAGVGEGGEPTPEVCAPPVTWAPLPAPQDGFLGTVVIPAYQAAGVVTRALDSVRQSVAWYRAWSDDAAGRFRIVVVDDHSADDTAAIAARWARPGDDLVVLRNRSNRGAGASRNVGAAAGLGPLLWYLDDDDAFLPPHLAATIALLRACPQAGYVRTGLAFDRPVHPSWYAAIEASTVYNLCVRRDVHDFVGGFIEDESVRRIICEDVLYNMALVENFTGARTPLPTVHHKDRLGNAFDRQYARFQRPVSESAADEPPRPPEHEHWRARMWAVAAQRGREVAARRTRPWDGPPLRTPDAPEAIGVDLFAG